MDSPESQQVACLLGLPPTGERSMENYQQWLMAAFVLLGQGLL
ncbi:MAG: hypothetical protein NXI32_04615 [bacterium]|nr:hypothetical protein [bacterium]